MGLKRKCWRAFHKIGGLSALRWLSRSSLRILMFHEFSLINHDNLESICSDITRNFEPVPLHRLAAAINGGKTLPANALAVTVDDGYQNYLLHGHPVFRRHFIPTTVYVVAGFAEGNFWLWTDQVAFAIQHTKRDAVRAEVQSGQIVEFDLSSQPAKLRALQNLREALKRCSNERRLRFLDALMDW